MDLEKLATSEMGTLWTTYEHDSMMAYLYQHAFERAEDERLKGILESARDFFQGNIIAIRALFQKNDFPIPLGFTDKDFHPNAPKLFTDDFWVYHIHLESAHWLTGYELGLTTASREDVRRFFKTCIQKAMDLYEGSLAELMQKGIYRLPPSVSTPKEVGFSHKQSLLTGWMGDRRPVNAMEITSLFFNIKKEQLTEALMLGFSQVAKERESRKFLTRIREVCSKQIEVMSSILDEDFLSSSGSWEPHVTDSTAAPFSDKLMMFHGQTMLNSSIIYFGAGLGTALRRDLGVHYTRAIAERMKLAEDGMNIAIEHGWVEKPPQAEDRKALTKV
ncbi:DUF3231 family protein [Ammoniphilus sp. YIM 78166]|uniref:DUF3231 family protein n=1 Tax=Ammoniphilus sp. YIM 78166 TaxID=1644106 RepID=UPI00142F60A2|nr:DUF3231 family protein [Ammoniphilus sp. YIM 78166]